MSGSKRGLYLLAGLPIAAALAAGAYWNRGTNADTAIRDPVDPQLLREGAEVYAQNCASCHGADLKGEPDWQSANPDETLKAPPHDETGHTWHHADELLFEITKYGTAKAIGLENFNSNMPAFEGTLSDAEIIAVLAWIKDQWPENIRAQHDMVNRKSADPRS
ncbi:c-type cytochrome [Roseibium aggregatum]|uniref:Cytochrome c n=1 Tax=Roseibium aggregatum TaxID=187304 RepID=A0A926P2K2_9HYPH|nr:cytochrome c [Roseibium aggregatum]MBD1548790.1 cytochrome c [Roseibium aggregatum]